MTRARTKIPYPPGSEPDFWNPYPPEDGYRYALGRGGSKPLVTVGMNPSHASDAESDNTINLVIGASKTLNYDGWTMVNLYPERSTKPRELNDFDPKLSRSNCEHIADYLGTHGITEVWGAWGDLPHAALRLAKIDVLTTLKSAGVRVFSFGTRTVGGEPRHPNPQGAKFDVTQRRFWLA